MPRKARKISSTGFYHVVIKGVNHEAIFEKGWQKEKFWKYFKTKRQENHIEVYAYCIMSTHMHAIVRGDLKELSKCMKETENKYALLYNSQCKRNGHLFENRYYSEVIENELYFWNCVNYIHNNPVKACMVKKQSDYKWSSFMEFRRMKAKDVSEMAIRMEKAKFGTPEVFEEFSQKREYDMWFYGTQEEIEQQKREIMELVYRKYFSEKDTFSSKSQILKCEKTKEMAKDFNFKMKEVADFLCEKYL